VGGRATFTVDAFPGETFSGTVSQIRKAAQVVQNVVTYTVVVEVANPDSRLLPGMTANVKLSVAEKRAALKVSNAALRFRPAGTEPERGPAGAGGTAAAGQASLENIRDRLVQTLTLTDEQQQKLETILQDSRRELQGLQGNTTIPEWQSRQQTLRVRQQARARIREILTPEQQVRYDQMQSSGGEGRGGVPGRVWIAGPDGKPQAVQVTLGITDGTSTEVLRGDVKEGQEVIVGFVGSAGPPGRSGSGGGGGAPRLRL
jgi:HlyD family secretion protein